MSFTSGQLSVKSTYVIKFAIYGLDEREFTLYAVADDIDEVAQIVKEHMNGMITSEEMDVKRIKLLDWPGVYLKEHNEPTE
jgi:hypothetical protein